MADDDLELRHEAAKAKEAYAAELDAIAKDSDLTPAGKNKQVGERYTAVTQKLRDLSGRLEEDERKASDQAKGAVFGVKYPVTATAVEKEQLKALRRQALDHADRTIKEPQDALRLLRRAIADDDEMGRRAALSVAHDRGFDGVLRTYAEEADESERERLKAYLAHKERNSDRGRRFARAQAFSPPPRPRPYLESVE